MIGENTERKCKCEYCTVESPILDKIQKRLGKKDNAIFDKMLSRWFHAEEDAVYWEMKFKGTWPGDKN